MKKIFLFFTLVSLINYDSNAQTNVDIQKSHALIQSYLLKKLNNPHSYRAVKWEKLSKTYTSFDETPIAKVLNDSLEYYKTANDELNRRIHKLKMDNIMYYYKDSIYKNHIELSRQLDSAQKNIMQIRSQKEAMYKPLLDGYMINHIFRARNRFNALVLQSWYFILDKKYRVIAAGDNEEAERERQKLQADIDELTNKH